MMGRRIQQLRSKFSLLGKTPKTYFGFPISDDEVSPEEEKKAKKSGISLLVATFVIVVASGFAIDLILASAVSVEMAFAYRDRIKAEYTAKSGFNLALYVLMIDWGVDLFKNQQKQPPIDGPGDWWSMLNDMPIGSSTVKMMAAFQEQFGLSRVMGADVMKQLELFDGEFVTNVSDESSKINVNFCVKGRCKRVEEKLKLLFDCPAERIFLEKKNIETEELFFRIKDYVDDNKRSESKDFSDEDDPYQKYQPPYGAKNAPLDSLNELKKVEGWDEEMHLVFSPYLTGFPFQIANLEEPMLNINTVSRELMFCLFPESRVVECAEKVALARKIKDEEKTNYDGAISEVLRSQYCYSAPSGEEATKSENNKALWFTNFSTTFQIVVSAEVGGKVRKIEAVVRRLDSREMTRKKTKQAYEILYWKLV